MDIIPLMDSSDEPWVYFTHGHVDPQEFFEACCREDRDVPAYGLSVKNVRHAYYRQTPDKRFCCGYCFHRTEKGRGAFAVTELRFQ